MHKINHLGQFRTRCIICRWQILRDRISTCVYFHQLQKMCWSWYFVQNYLGFNPDADSHFGTWFQVLRSAFGSSSDDPYTATMVFLQSTTVDRRNLLPHSSLSSWPDGECLCRKEGRKEGSASPQGTIPSFSLAIRELQTTSWYNLERSTFSVSLCTFCMFWCPNWWREAPDRKLFFFFFFFFGAVMHETVTTET